MKRIVAEDVLPGDILLTARRGKVSASVRLATGGLVSHAMICVQMSSVIDSTEDGVQARNLQRELFEDDEQVFQFRPRQTLEREVLSNIVDYARAEIGARYSRAEAARSAFGVRKPRSRRQFCSRLVARAYREAGLKLVRDADYCTPEDLRRSPFLVEVPLRTEQVSSEEEAWWAASRDPLAATRRAQNSVLASARAFDPAVETMSDIHALLVAHPEADREVAAALRDSGYLDLWKLETNSFPWRYDQRLLDGLSDVPLEPIRKYCIGTVGEAYGGGARFSINLVQLRILLTTHRRQAFALEVRLYETLVQNDQRRREVAYTWLARHYPDDLRLHMEQVEPHSAYWFSIVDRVEPKLAVISRFNVDTAGDKNVCSTCGDRPTIDYRLVNGAETMPGVPSLRLCDDCIGIRRGMENVLEPFLTAT